MKLIVYNLLKEYSNIHIPSDIQDLQELDENSVKLKIDAYKIFIENYVYDDLELKKVEEEQTNPNKLKKNYPDKYTIHKNNHITKEHIFLEGDYICETTQKPNSDKIPTDLINKNIHWKNCTDYYGKDNKCQLKKYGYPCSSKLVIEKYQPNLLSKIYIKAYYKVSSVVKEYEEYDRIPNEMFDLNDDVIHLKGEIQDYGLYIYTIYKEYGKVYKRNSKTILRWKDLVSIYMIHGKKISHKTIDASKENGGEFDKSHIKQFIQRSKDIINRKFNLKLD